MTRLRTLVLAALAWPLIALAGASVALAAPNFPPLTGRVVDNAKILSPPTVQKLDQDLAALEAQTGHQLVVATIPDLQGYEIEDYGYQLGRTWALGRKGEDDGAILLVAPKERKVRIEVGYGLEPVLTDALSSLILQSAVLPQFREGNMERGVVDGTAALIQQLSLPEDQAKAQVVAAEQQPAAGSGGSAIPVIFVVLIIFWVLGGLMRAFGGKRGRRGRGDSLWWLAALLLSSRGGGGGGGWGGGGGGFGGGGFSGGGGSFGGGGSSGSW